MTTRGDKLYRWSKAVYREALRIMAIALPMAVTQVCQAVLGFEDLLFVSQLGSTHLAAAALGNAYTICLSYAASGLATALDTLISQAYGARQFHLIGIAVNRAIIVTTLACVPIGLLFWFSTQIFLLAGQDKNIAILSGRFVRYLIPGLWPLVILRTLTGYLVNQNMQKYPMIIAISSTVINLVAAYVLVLGVGFKGLGFIGAPIATSLTRIIQLLMLIVVMLVLKLYKKTWNGLYIRETFRLKGMWEFMKLAIPGMFLVILDIWGFEATALPAGLISPDSLASHSVILNIYVLALTIPLGVSIAGSVRIGMRLGAGKPQKAKESFILTLFIAVCIQASICLAVFLLRYVIAHLFATDPKVISLIVHAIPISSSFQIFDAAQAACGGALRGIGRPILGSVATLFAYWIIGLPLGSLLAFKFKLKLYGLWSGLAVGAFSSASFQFVVLMCLINWKKESEEAVKRATPTIPDHQHSPPYAINSVNQDEHDSYLAVAPTTEQSPLL